MSGKKIETIKFEEGEMTMKEFIEWLRNKFGKTTTGKEFDVMYAHTLCTYGHLPRVYGGNLLRVRRVRGIKTVMILPEKFKFYEREEDYVAEGQIGATTYANRLAIRNEKYLEEGNKSIFTSRVGS